MFVDTTTGTIKDMSTGEVFNISPDADDGEATAAAASDASTSAAAADADASSPSGRSFVTASAEDDAEVRQVTQGLSYMDIYYGSKSSGVSMASDTGMGAKTKPLVNGVGSSVVATGVAPGSAHTGAPSADLGYTVNLLPKNDSLPVQMRKLMQLRISDPEAASALCDRCEKLVQLSAQGYLGEMKEVVAEIIADKRWGRPPPLWFIAKIFRAAAPEGHTGVVRWLVEGGGVNPIDIPPLADILHLVVERTPPRYDGTPPQSTLDMLTYLVTHGFDVNTARKPDFWTPLHAACSRNLTAVGLHLLELGADVNAVAKDDLMPLHLTDRMYEMMVKSSKYVPIDSDEEVSEDEDEEPLPPPPLHAALLARGARRTWRRDHLAGLSPAQAAAAVMAPPPKGAAAAERSAMSGGGGGGGGLVRSSGGGSGGGTRFTGFAGGGGGGGGGGGAAEPATPPVRFTGFAGGGATSDDTGSGSTFSTS